MSRGPATDDASRGWSPDRTRLRAGDRTGGAVSLRTQRPLTEQSCHAGESRERLTQTGKLPSMDAIDKLNRQIDLDKVF